MAAEKKFGLRVMAKQCNECLFSKSKIVNEDAKKRVLSICFKEGEESHFICHKASNADEDICCAGFYARYPDNSAYMQVSRRLGLVSTVTEEELQSMAGKKTLKRARG